MPDMLERIVGAADITPEKFVHDINKRIKTFREKDGDANIGDITDGFHTFNELYDHRAKLFATIVNNGTWNRLAWKSKQHEDGSMFDGMFIVGINTPTGQASYHYDMKYWDVFNCEEIDHAPHYDGYSDEDSVARIMSLNDSQNDAIFIN